MSFRYGKASLVAGILLAFSTNAHAMVLWDQSTIVPAGPGIAASNSSGFGGVIAHSVDDVTVPASGWVITKITQYYSAFEPNWVGGVTQGFLNIQPKSGSLPTGPVATTQIPMSAVFDAAQGARSASGSSPSPNVSISLPAGDYWIGITPSKSATINGVNLMWPSAMVSDPVATFSSGAWHSSYLGWDGAFLIQGDLPVPAQSSTWGNLKAHYH
jgi:hypothetical protein